MEQMCPAQLAPLQRLMTLNVNRMTRRELECCPLLALGYSSAQIAKTLGISVRTVEHHVNNLKYKCRCENKQVLCDYLRQVLNLSPANVLELARAKTRLKPIF